MIKRTRDGVNTLSLVNTAQNEHFNVAEGIRTDVPITNLTSIPKSINFSTNQDGSCSLRHPLVLKEFAADNKWYLYDKVHILEIQADYDAIMPSFKYYIHNSETLDNALLKLKYYDVNNKEHILNLSDNDRELSFLKFLNIYNTPDVTFLFVEFTRKQTADNTTTPNHNGFVNYIRNYNANHIQASAPEDIYYEALNYDKITESEYDSQNLTFYKTYRLLKIYKDLEDENNDTWIIEIVSPELNSFTSNLNSEGLDINLLLDNPYAVRDLYNYGYIGTSKILPYVAMGNLTVSEINNLHVYELTEGLQNPTTKKGFRIVNSTNTVDMYGKILVLKAFLTTALTDVSYYCVWEESVNGGIDWQPCQEFLNKFSNSLIEKTVMDLTIAEFEENLKKDTNLDVEGTYLVTKKLVQLNKVINGLPVDLSQEDLISTRPDVLVLTNSNPLKKYRFQIYVDTDKKYGDTPINITQDLSKTSFSTLTGDLFLGYKYDATIHQGKKYSGGSIVDSSAEISGIGSNRDRIYLYPAATGKELPIIEFWEYAADNNANESYKGNGIKVYLDGSTPEDGYPTFLKVCGNKSGIILIEIPKTSGGVYYRFYQTFWDADTVVELPVSSTDVNLSEIYIYNAGTPVNSSAHDIYVSKITLTYVMTKSSAVAKTFLTSSTGDFLLTYSENTEYAKDLTSEHSKLFTGTMYDDNNHLFIYNKYGLYASNADSLTFPLMKSVTIPTEIVNVIAWRSYLLIFTEKDITLASYDISTDAYNYKILSNSLGVPKEDAKTIACVLNSIYFKSENQILRLTPNLYASKDDILNIYPVSEKVNLLLEKLLAKEIESNNFSYTNAEYYYIFIPLKNLDTPKTYALRYSLTTKVWNLFEYPIIVDKVESLGAFDEYLKSKSGIYYFNDSLDIILSKTYAYEFIELTTDLGDDIWTTDSYTNYEISCLNDAKKVPIKDLVIDFPYTDILYTPILTVYNAITNTNAFKGYIDEGEVLYIDVDPEGFDATDIALTPIHFLIDFGQKSSNYTVFKSFLETKITLGTLSEFDYFPFELTISTDGITQNSIHWDVNTDSAIWKNSYYQKGTAGTLVPDNESDYDGIVRQLIVKYSSKGKTIRHIIEGYSKSNFKFYSMDVRSRILPKKQ